MPPNLTIRDERLDRVVDTDPHQFIYRMTEELIKLQPQNRPTREELEAARFQESKRRHAWNNLKRNHPGIRQVQQYLEHSYPRKFCIDDVLRVLINNYWTLQPELPDFPEDSFVEQPHDSAEAAGESLT